MNDFLTLKGGEVDVGGAPEVISVLPFGHVVSQKGEFDVDEESLAAMKEQIAQRGVDLVVDYEHQTLTGERAPCGRSSPPVTEQASGTSPCARRPWERSTSWGIWTKCWSCAPWMSA